MNSEVTLTRASPEDPAAFAAMEQAAFRRIVVATKGQGIGQVAIPLMEAFCRRELERSRIWLDVFEHNTRGRHIYEKLGYRHCGESGCDGRTLLIYRKDLEPFE